MTYCAMTAAANLHEAHESLIEEQYDANEERYFNCLNDPVLRYRVDGAWDMDDAERLHRVLEIVLPCKYQVIQDTKFAYPDDSDTDLHLTGVESPVLEFATATIISALTDRKFGEKQAQEKYDKCIGEWND